MIFKKKKHKASKGVLTLLFINIKGYVSLSEDLTPEHVVEFLKKYIKHCDKIISQHGGQISRIEADRIMAAWIENDKIDNQKCCQCAIELIRSIPELKTKVKKECSSDLSVFISVSRGECLYVIEGGNFSQIIGDAAIKVEQINGAQIHTENTILVDDSVKSTFINFSYKKVTGEENLYVLEKLGVD